MKRMGWLLLVLTAGTVPLAARVLAQHGGSGRTIMLACNIDGTYTCGGNCMGGPYNGRGCCQLPLK